MTKIDYQNTKKNLSKLLNPKSEDFLKDLVSYIVFNKKAYDLLLINSQELGESLCGLIMYQENVPAGFVDVFHTSCDLELPGAHIGGDRGKITNELVAKIETLENNYLK